MDQFKEINIDTTIKILKKLKRLFYNRAVIVAILQDIKQREFYCTLTKNRIRELLTSDGVSDITDISVEALKGNLKFIYETNFKITAGINNLFTEGLIFGTDTNKGKMLFKFANRDYPHYIAHEADSFTNLIQMMEIIAMTQSQQH